MSGPMAVTRRAGIRARCALLLALICAVAAGCGGGDTTPSAGQQDHGKQLFVANCAGCHTLSAAGTQGTKGPNLD
jgi:mono/diheme cytochrome c family protein